MKARIGYLFGPTWRTRLETAIGLVLWLTLTLDRLNGGTVLYSVWEVTR